MITVLAILVLAAFLTNIAAAMGKCPEWVPIFALCTIALIQVFPVK